VSGHGLGDRSSIPGKGRNFVFATTSRPVLKTAQPPAQWALGIRFSEIKRPKRETDLRSLLSLHDVLVEFIPVFVALITGCGKETGDYKDAVFTKL
jgi:hypothetical protein